jgi:hypothetical protein
VQRWRIEGTFLRNVRISGKRGMSLNAADSVLEECDFWKDDAWYDFWWSTRWKFKNCIFTKKFIRGDLPPLDYSAHATGLHFLRGEVAAHRHEGKSGRIPAERRHGI